MKPRALRYLTIVLNVKPPAIDPYDNEWRCRMRHVQKLRALGLKSATAHRIRKEIIIFFAAALFVALLAATYGLDLSPGLF